MKNIILLSLSVLMVLTTTNTTVYAQGMSINTTGSVADSSAMLDVASTSKGLLPPRMTKAQRNAIVNPKAGLMVYNTDCDEMDYYSAISGWRSFSGGGIPVANAPTAGSTASRYTSYTASWSAASGNVTGYYIDVSTNSTFTSFVTGYENLNVGNVLTENLIFPCGASHYYRVRAAFCSGDGDNSNTVGAVLGTPVSTAATSITRVSFTANWTAPADGATGYYLDVATDSAFTSFVSGYNNLSVGNVLSEMVSFTCGSYNTLYYRVRSTYCSGTYSSNSNITTVSGILHGTQTFAYTGSSQTFTVPCGISLISVQITGADGGGGSYYKGGSGSVVNGTLAVTAGSVLTLVVGGGGYEIFTGVYSYDVGVGSVGSYGGGGGGGSGGSSTEEYGSYTTFDYGGGSGGGRSAIQITSGTDRVTAAGGGGGNNAGASGGGGDGNGGDFTGSGAGAGKKGTATAGGAASTGCDNNGTAGSSYTGGNGGSGDYTDSDYDLVGFGGGGGGGGYYGGGGGGDRTSGTNFGGGGGGASFTTGTGFTGTVTPGTYAGANTTIYSNSSTSANGSITISY